MSNRDKPSTAEGIAASIRDRITHGETVLRFGDVLREVARKMEGRKVDKRLYTAVKARAAEVFGPDTWTLHYAADDWGAKIEAWQRAPGSTIEHGSRLSFTVARWHHFATTDNHEVVSEVWIMARNQRYFLEAERLPKYRAALDAGKPAAWAAALAQIAAARKALGEDATGFGLNYLLDI